MTTTLEKLASDPRVASVLITENNQQWSITIHTGVHYTPTGDPSNPFTSTRPLIVFANNLEDAIAEIETLLGTL